VSCGGTAIQAILIESFVLQQFEIANDWDQSLQRPWHFSRPACRICLSLLNARWGNQAGFAPHSGNSNFPLPVVLPRFYNWTLNPFHMMGVGVLRWGVVVCGATVQKTRCLKTVMLQHLPCASTRLGRPTQWLPPAG